MFVAWIAMCGCSGSAPLKPDAIESAEATLHVALDAWKGGKSLAEFEASANDYVVNEPFWKQGDRLVEYQQEGAGRQLGIDWEFAIKITLATPANKKVTRIVRYTVGTQPRKTVIRSNDDN